MILILVVILIILARAAVYLLSKRKPKTVRFVGPRGTGKTATTNALAGIESRTVPTLESYKITYNGVTVHDIIEKSGDFLERYSIDDPEAIYFFFLKNIKDMDVFPETKGFNIKFVYHGMLDEKEASERGIIILNGDPAEIKKYIPWGYH